MLTNASFIRLYCKINETSLGTPVRFKLNNGESYWVIKTHLYNERVLAVIRKSDNGLKLILANANWEQELGAYLTSLGAVSLSDLS